MSSCQVYGHTPCDGHNGHWAIHFTAIPFHQVSLIVISFDGQPLSFCMPGCLLIGLISPTIIGSSWYVGLYLGKWSALGSFQLNEHALVWRIGNMPSATNDDSVHQELNLVGAGGSWDPTSLVWAPSPHLCRPPSTHPAIAPMSRSWQLHYCGWSQLFLTIWMQNCKKNYFQEF